MRTILLILAGLGERGHAIFGGKTPLQAARTPNLIRISMASINGLYHSYVPEAAMSSELAYYLMCGYAIDDFPGRRTFEATGLGIELEGGDVALLARVVSVQEREGMLILKDEDPPAEEETCRVLLEQIRTFEQDGVVMEFIPTGE